MRRITLGVVGHVDHGKTALVRALTGIETDRLPEERRRGVSIALGFAHAEIDGAQVDFIDMPGHERFVRTMVSGATGMQAALLVVAANEGVKPQTREHAAIAALLGVRRVVIAVTKAELADPTEASRQAAALVAAAGLQADAPTPVSALTGEGLDALRAAIGRSDADAPAPREDGLAWLPIDRAFSINGAGIVVTGTLRRGRLARGDTLAITPGGGEVRVRGLQVHGAAVDTALPGQRVAANLRGAALASLGRGVALVTPDQLAQSEWLTAELTVPPGAPELRTGARLNLLVGTAEGPVRLRLLGGDALPSGASGLAQLHASVPLSVPARERFILRTPSPPATVAGGRVIDPDARRLRRRAPGELAHLAALGAAADGTEATTLAIARAAEDGVPVVRLARLAGVGLDQAPQLLKGVQAELTRTGVAVAAAAFSEVMAQVPQALQRGPLSLPSLRAAVRAGPQVLDEAVLRLAAAGRLRLEGGAVRLVDAGRDRARAQDEASLAVRLAEALRRGGLQPPDVAADAAPREARRALERLVREHVAVRTYDRVQKREIVFHRDAVEAARRALAPHLTGRGLKVTEAGAILGISRKYSVPLLEHLDAIQFTRREGDRRTLGPGAAA